MGAFFQNLRYSRNLIQCFLKILKLPKKKKSPDNCGKCYKMLFLDPIGKKQAYFKGELCISLEEQQPAVYVKMRTAER